jgi:hypothetical protein
MYNEQRIQEELISNAQEHDIVMMDNGYSGSCLDISPFVLQNTSFFPEIPSGTKTPVFVRKIKRERAYKGAHTR